MMRGYVTSQETSFTIHCHDKFFRKVTAMGDDGEVLFRIERAAFGKSWSLRRRVTDSAGRHVYDFRHNSLDITNGWVVEDPDHQKICFLGHTSFLTKGHAAVTAKVRTTAGEDVLVTMLPCDIRALMTKIEVQGSTIATIVKIADNPYLFSNGDRDRSTWRLRVAAGVDLTLVSPRPPFHLLRPRSAFGPIIEAVPDHSFWFVSRGECPCLEELIALGAVSLRAGWDCIAECTSWTRRNMQSLPCAAYLLTEQ